MSHSHDDAAPDSMKHGASDGARAGLNMVNLRGRSKQALPVLVAPGTVPGSALSSLQISPRTGSSAEPSGTRNSLAKQMKGNRAS